MSTLFIKNVQLVLANDVKLGAILIENNIIQAIYTGDDHPSLSNETEVIDGQGGYILPGFIDVHVHGGGGYDFMEATQESYEGITKYHAKHGTTTMLATTVTAGKSDIDAVLQCTAQFKASEMPYTQLLGVHLEGPFINKSWCGAQNPDHILPPNMEWLQDWTSKYPELVKLITIAPEQPNSIPFIEESVKQNIIIAAGHTDATFDQMMTAKQAGLSHAVHTYNAMRALHHREPGTLGAVMYDDDIYAEIIADGHHVRPEAISILAKNKPYDKLIAITDAVSASGMPDGPYMLGDLAIHMENGVARLENGTTLAGSTLTMIEAFKFFVDKLQFTLPRAAAVTSTNAARRLGIDNVTGSIETGKKADLVWVNSSFEIQSVWSEGKSIYTKQ